jgi:hypothetical protein
MKVFWFFIMSILLLSMHVLSPIEPVYAENFSVDSRLNLSNNGFSFHPSIAVSGSNVYVVWEEDVSGNGDIFFSRSIDNGDTFDTPANISNNGFSFNPSIAVACINVYVVWEEDTLGGSDVLFIPMNAEAHVLNLMTVYCERLDLQAAFPEATNGVDLSNLFGWSSRHGVDEDARLTPFTAVYRLMEVYYDEPELQEAFPEATNGVDLSNLFAWAAQIGVDEDARLTPFTAVYRLMEVYYERLDLQAAFPEATNGVDLSNLFCWAKNHGVAEDSRLTPYADFYTDQCP